MTMQAAPGNMPIIELADAAVASVHNREIPEVEGITWGVVPGEFWVIGGLHGLGQSNLAATISGLSKPLRGSVKLFGRDVSALPESELLHERRRIGLVFGEGGRMLKHLTVAENVALPLRYHLNLTSEDSEPYVRQILALTGLENIAHNTSGVISANWQQRVGLARALALRPEIVLLDKPLVGLKATHRSWWLAFLKRLAAGIPEAELNPLAVIATTDEFGSWKEPDRQFALVRRRSWLTIGNIERLESGSWREEHSDDKSVS